MAHTADIPRGHGTMPMIVDLVVEDPDTYRRYGRAFIRRMAATCPFCHVADARHARIRRMRSAYGRRSR
jgi:hypothetical protein